MTGGITLRPMLPADGPVLAALFRASIAILAEDDYDEDQRDAWAARADDERAFGTALAAKLTLVATMDGTTAGFAALEGNDRIAMLYVAPAFARRGVATHLLDATLRLAGARGAATVRVDASDAARDFFAVRGFVPMVRNMVPLKDQWLGNTTMQRELTPPPRATGDAS